MRVVIPIRDILFLVQLVDRNLAQFGLPVTYVYTGPADGAELIRQIAPNSTVDVSHTESDWILHWEEALRQANRVEDVWMLESDLFFLSDRWFSQMRLKARDYDLVSAYARRGGFAPHCVWLRRGLLDTYPHISIKPQTVDGEFLDTMDCLTKRMIEDGVRSLHLPHVEMLHVLGVSVAVKEMKRLVELLGLIKNGYDLRTAQYVCQGIFKYLFMYERWGHRKDFFPREEDLLVIMQAFADRDIDVVQMSKCVSQLEPLERIFPRRSHPSNPKCSVSRLLRQIEARN
jgi:hypothetical protein